MTRSFLTPRLARFGFCSLVFLATLCAVSAAERKMEARLIWGTNDDKSPDPKHKPLDGELAKKLGEMPLKWKNYFEVNRQIFTINDKEYTNVVMSKLCSIQVKDKGANMVTVKLYGKGTQVNRVDKPLPVGEILTIGGDDKNSNAWFITVRPLNSGAKIVEPKKDGVIAKPAAPK